MAVDMKQMIAEKLTELLEHKSVDKITVKELVDACGISRQAFYYHFQDLMEVIEWIGSQAIQSAVEDSLAAPTPREAIKSVILTLRKRGKLIQRLMTSQRRPEIERLLVEATRTYLAKMLRAKAAELTARPAELTVNPGDLEAALHFYSYGLAGMLAEHLEGDADADVLADQLCRLLSRGIRGLDPNS